VLVCGARSSVHGSLQTAPASEKPALERQLAQIDRDIETTDKEITKMSFLVPQACGKVIFYDYTVFQITCDYVFDDKVELEMSVYNNFWHVIRKSIGHRQILLFSYLTYFVHLLYVGKLSRPNYQ